MWATAADDLSTFLQEDVDPALAAMLVAMASSEVRGHCRWNITEQTDQEVVLDGDGSRLLHLPTLRLTAVSSVLLDGYALVDGGDFSWSESGWLRALNRVWPHRDRCVHATITHGYADADLPEDLKLVVLTAAGRTWANPTGAKSERLADWSVSYTVDLLDHEQQILNRYRLP